MYTTLQPIFLAGLAACLIYGHACEVEVDSVSLFPLQRMICSSLINIGTHGTKSCMCVIQTLSSKKTNTDQDDSKNVNIPKRKGRKKNNEI